MRGKVARKFRPLWSFGHSSFLRHRALDIRHSVQCPSPMPVDLLPLRHYPSPRSYSSHPRVAGPTPMKRRRKYEIPDSGAARAGGTWQWGWRTSLVAGTAIALAVIAGACWHVRSRPPLAESPGVELPPESPAAPAAPPEQPPPPPPPAFERLTPPTEQDIVNGRDRPGVFQPTSPDRPETALFGSARNRTGGCHAAVTILRRRVTSEARGRTT